MSEDFVNARAQLREEDAETLQDSEALPQWGAEGTIRQAWDVSPEYTSECEKFLLTYTSVTNAQPSLSMKGLVFNRTAKPGIFRLVSVKVEVHNDRPLLVRTIRPGWTDSLVWDESRLLDRVTAPGNAETVGSETCDSPEDIIQVRFPNLNRKKIKAIQDGIPTTFVDPKIDGTTYTGTYYTVISQAQREKDGSSFIDIIIANPVFALNGFDDLNTNRERRVGYLWQLPKSVAQSVIDAWDSPTINGRSATPSFSPDRKLVNLVLTASVGLADNLTTPWIKVSCTTYKRFHFGWGYTKDEVSAFLLSHANEVGTTDSAGVIVSAILDVNTRGDGFYDVIISQFAAEEKSAADLDFTVSIGTKTTLQRIYGWDVPAVSVSALLELYTEAAVGKTVQIEVTKQRGECSYDFTGTIRLVVEDTETLTTTAPTVGGTSVKIAVGKNMADPNTLVSGFTPAIRKRMSASVKINEDETRDAELQEQTVSESQDSIVIDGAAGIGVTAKVGRNVDPGDGQVAAASMAGAKRKRHSVQLSGNDEGSQNFSLLEQTVQAVLKSGNYGDSVVVSGTNQDDIPGTIDPATSVIKFAQIKGNDDGSVDFNLSYSPLYQDETTIQDNIAGGSTYVQAGQNANSIPTVPTGERLLSAFARLGDNGKFDYGIVSRDYTLVTTGAIGYGEKLKTRSTTWTENDPNPPTSGVLAQAVSFDITARPNDQGKFDHAVTEIRSVPESKTITLELNSIRNVAAVVAKYQTSFPTLTANQILTAVLINDDQTYNYILRTLALGNTTTYTSAETKGYEVQTSSAQSKNKKFNKLIGTSVSNDDIFNGFSVNEVRMDWARTVEITNVAIFSLDPPSVSTSYSTQRSITEVDVRQIGEVWIKFTATKTVGAWFKIPGSGVAAHFYDIEVDGTVTNY